MNTDSIVEFNSLYELILHFDTPEKCEEHLINLRWNGEPTCPTCGCKKVGTLKGKRKQFKCYGCKRKFSVKTGSIFHDSKLPLLKWFVAIYLFSSHKRGISSHQLAKDIKVSQKSAWYMLHRIRECFVNNNEEKLDGVVQIDETYVGGDMNRMNAKTKAKYEETGNTGGSQKTAVFGIMNKKEVRVIKIEEADKETIEAIMKGEIEKDAIVVTDGYGAYNWAKKYYKGHIKVSHAKGQYVNDGYTTNNIENFWSHFKRGVIGTYFHMSEDHMNSYVTEFAFRYNTRKMGEGVRFDMTLANSNKTLSWNELVERTKSAA
jgi:transposase-like protein